MFHWIIKIFALLTCIALILGLAAETTTLIGDAASQNPRLEKTKNPVGLMLVKRQNNRNNNKPPKCEAYAWNTDFSQRQGAIFHGAFYHALTITGFLAMLVHQGLRGIAPNTLPALYKFVPSLQGQWGLWATGAIMVYAGLQTMSYSIGKLHLLTSGLLMLVGVMNFCGGFFHAIASANAPPPPLGAPPDMGGDPYGDDMFGAPPSMPGAGGPPEAKAPDPYGHGGKGNGIGAGAAPPGMFTKGARTSGGIPSRFGAKFNEDDDDSDDDGGDQMVVDPRTGLWTKAKYLNQMPGMIPMPMGYDVYGRPVMTPTPYAGYMPNTQMNDGASKRSSRSLKKAIKRQARKEFEKMRRLDEEDEEDISDDDDRASISSARRHRREERARLREEDRKQREFERQVREEEKRQQMIAKGIAIVDAKQRAAQEVAQEDARMRNYQEMLDNQRQLAMTDAQRKHFQNEMNEMREQQLLVLAKRKAQLDAQERARQDQEMYQRQMYQARQQHLQQQQQVPRYPPPAAVPMRASTVSGSRSLPPYSQYAAESGRSVQPLHLPGQRSQPPSYRGHIEHSSARGFDYAPSGQQQRYAGPPPNQNVGYRNNAEPEEFDFDDDITEIQSVRSETSSQRHLIMRRMQEERERVLDAQERERSLNSRSRNVS